MPALRQDQSGEDAVQGLPLPDWAVISGAIAGLVFIAKPIIDALGVVEKAFVFLSKIVSALKLKSPAVPGIPHQTVVVIPESRINAFWWSIGAMADTPLMQVVADFYVTNATERPIQLAGALLKINRWIFVSRTERGNTMVKDLRSVYSGDYAIPPHRMTKVRADFYFARPFAKPKKAFNSRIGLIDQYGNEHWVYVRFKHVDAMLEP